MKIIDILNRKNMSLSFEVFPPKKESGFETVKATTEEIAACNPAFMSVTYGAGGGTSRFTLDIAKDIEDKYHVPTLAHLTCVSSSRAMVKEKIEQMHAMGIDNIMALRGDLTPELESTDRKNWEYHYAVELVREIKESGYDFCVGAACYPEVHPESANQRDDIKFLKEKVDAGVDFLTSQMVFDNNLFYNYLYKNHAIENNPAIQVSVPKLHEKVIIRLDPDETVLFQRVQGMGHGQTPVPGLFHDVADSRQPPSARQGQQNILQIFDGPADFFRPDPARFSFVHRRKSFVFR